MHRKYLKHFIENAIRFEGAFNNLEDKRSKELFTELILYRILGHKHVRLMTNTPEHWSFRKKASEYPNDKSDLTIKHWTGDLRFFKFEHMGRMLNFHGTHRNLAWSFFIKQYFYDHGGVRIQPEPGDHVLDLGACNGDTAILFASAVGEEGHVYSFDFMPSHINVIRRNIADNAELKECITLFPYAVGDRKNNAPALEGYADTILPGSSLFQGEMSKKNIPTVSIDGMFEEGKIKKVDFIKMDIEGYELKALHGAKKAIERFKPKLAISLYHKVEDFYTIPEYIKSLNEDYKLYLDHYTIYGEETILYAI